LSTITRPCYATREQAKAALDVAATAYADSRIDRAVEAGSGGVDGLCHRRFYPTTTTRYFDWPGDQISSPWRLWLGANEVITVTAVTAGGVVLPPSSYFLRRSDDLDEPPYSRIEIDLSSTSAFSTGPTFQRSIAVAGVFGASASTAAAGATAEALDASETGVDVTDSAAVGVGDLIGVDSERMLITGRALLTTGQTTTLAASAAATSATVADGTAIHPGEILTVDAERILVQDVAGNVAVVKRAVDGTALAAHAAATLYAPRTLTVFRGHGGTTPASHLTAAPLSRYVAPPLARDLALAYALNQHLQEMSGYARIAGQGENAREWTGRGVKQIEDDCYRAHGRKARTYAV